MVSPGELVVLVDEQDRELGVMEKMRAHKEGALHRAISVLVRDASGRLILQQRAAGKYHGARLWSNTACGHPRPGEAPHSAAKRRLSEEMGLSCDLRPVGTFIYRAPLGELIEHEVDHVFVGEVSGDPLPDPSEVMAWRTVEAAGLERDLREFPQRYTPWLGYVLEMVDRD